ncbi:alpha/beta fold hydrolase [Winogradskyella forsetii]|uniref:alpha/beta fold hydrolase n=1 Tax=Winogradskyella forsetii TaxID=2686077 RepID=UPI0015BA86CF|nr:alpha/beta hydrolase [Winogradskyella forsetii]
MTLPGFDNTSPLEEKSIRSFSQWISDQIKALDLDNYILVGHSMGGKLALFTAFINHDCLPQKMILIAPSPPTIENMTAEEKKRMLNHPDQDSAVTTVEQSTNKKLNRKRFKYAVESQLKVDNATWKWWIETGMTNDISWAIKNIDVPTFVICSKNDPVITTNAIQEEVLPYLETAKLITFGRSGHLIPMESPRKLAKVIKKIIKT